MAESPYHELSAEDQLRLLDTCMNCDQFIFAGEKYTVPGGTNNRHLGITSRLYEVDAEKLLTVAKDIIKEGESVGKAVERAYALICETEVFSRNLCHWNSKVDRGHVSKRISDIVETVAPQEGSDSTPIDRKKVLMAFEEARPEGDRLATEKKASERFNKWIKDKIRTEDLLEVTHWHQNDPKHDLKLKIFFIRTDGSKR